MNTYLLPQIRELSDAMITLDSNFTQMNFIHESLVDLNESISALLYGLMCNSWCVDFPNMPHDTLAQLKTMQKLQSLEEEHLQLQKKLALKKREKENNSLPNSQELSKRHLPPTGSIFAQQSKRQLSAQGARNWTPTAPASPEPNDEDNTDASFVSNPPIFATTSSKSRHMRRKSMLHTMRSSVAGSQDMQDDAKRRSLAVSASRIVNPVRATTTNLTPTYSRNPTVPSRNNKVTKDTQSTRRRPPFR